MEENKKNINIKIRKTTRRHISDFLSVLLSFLLSMVLVGLSLLMVLQYYCFQENAILRALSSSNYYKNSYTELVNRVTTATLPTGLPIELLQEVFRQDELEEDTVAYIEALFHDKGYLQDDVKIKTKLKASIDAFLDRQDGIEGIQLDKRINEYIDLLLIEYKKAVKLPLLDYFMKIRKEYQIIHFLGMSFCVSMIVLIIIILLKLNGWLHRSLRYIAYSTLASALMLGVVPILLLMSKSYNRLHLSPEVFNGFITRYIVDIAGAILKMSAGYAILSIVIILTGKGIKANLIKFYKLSKG